MNGLAPPGPQPTPAAGPPPTPTLQAFAHGPPAAAPLRAALAWAERALDAVYTSRFNPLYRSGTLAAGLLFVVIATGFYLLLFYKVGAPYASMQNIQAQTWAGRWVRSVHRYASDAAVVVTLFHLFRMVAEGKAWGPRVLAWVSGTVLVGVLLVSGWTGYIMVWDVQGLEVARAIAAWIDAIPLLATDLSRSFMEPHPPGASFFFMNLFLHVAAPLGMVAGLAVHTARLARSRWVPPRAMMVVMCLGLLATALVWPAPLPPAAQPAVVVSDYPLDVFYLGFLRIPLGAGWGWALTALVALVVTLMPWWFKPRAEQAPPPSEHDPSRCEGCGQCASDCPFEAISMKPRQGPGISDTVAMVDPALCTSCGLCAGSCTRLAIGPPGRNGLAQLQQIRSVAGLSDPQRAVVVACGNHPDLRRLTTALHQQARDAVIHTVDCVGSVHAYSLGGLLKHFQCVFVLSCADELCMTREGCTVLRHRIAGKQGPGIPQHWDARRVAMFSASAADVGPTVQAFRALVDAQRNPQEEPTPTAPRRHPPWRFAAAAAVTAAAAAGLVTLSAVPSGAVPPQAYLRFALQVPARAMQVCRTLSADELAKRPAHMRLATQCTNTGLTYNATVTVDGQPTVDALVDAGPGRHGDMLRWVQQFPAPLGTHQVDVVLTPRSGAEENQVYRGSFAATFEAGRAVIVTYDAEQGVLTGM